MRILSTIGKLNCPELEAVVKFLALLEKFTTQRYYILTI